MVRRQVCSTLTARSDFEVCGEAANGREAVKFKELKPDLVILDITMPLMNGLDAARADSLVLSKYSGPNSLPVHKSKQLIEEARRIGVRGYVTKEDAVQSLVQASGRRSSGTEPFFPLTCKCSKQTALRDSGPRSACLTRFS